jgi:hypothetical protein
MVAEGDGGEGNDTVSRWSDSSSSPSDIYRLRTAFLCFKTCVEADIHQVQQPELAKDPARTTMSYSRWETIGKYNYKATSQVKRGKWICLCGASLRSNAWSPSTPQQCQDSSWAGYVDLHELCNTTLTREPKNPAKLVLGETPRRPTNASRE